MNNFVIQVAHPDPTLLLLKIRIRNSDLGCNPIPDFGIALVSGSGYSLTNLVLDIIKGSW